MRTPLLIALALIVLLPVGALGWLGLRLMASEQQALEHRVQTLVDAQLSAIDETLAGYFGAREAEFIAAAADLPQETEALRRYIQHAAPVRQVFIMDAQGERVHPPRNAPLTESEQRFLERSADIWRDKDIIYQGGGAAPAPAAPTANPAPPSVSSAARPSAPIKAEGTRTRGWYVWHWGAETDLIFWRRDAQGELLGFELEPAQVMADLIALLPATGGADDRLGDARVQLIDDRGTVVYQWGGFQPDPAQHALAVRPLGHPLGSWKLSYYAPALAAGQGARWLTLVSALTALALAVGGLALYLYREHTREMRIAHQRVNFVNQVSHELKTPLTNIRMYAELLADQIDEAEDKPRRYIDIIVAESQRLSRLILNVLNFARLQRQRLGLRRQPGNVDQVVGATLEAFRPALAGKSVAIDFRAGAGADVSLDADALEQILNNLFSNVEKYAAAGGRLEVATWQEGDFSHIVVRDHGPGIPKRERERIFQPFYRIGAKLNEGVTGTGIGLTIARELARLHGGDLTLVAGGKGACFQVTLHTSARC